MSLVAERDASLNTRTSQVSTSSVQAPHRNFPWAYVVGVILGLLLMGAFGGWAYAGVASSLAMVVLSIAYLSGTRPHAPALFRRQIDGRDLTVVLAIYAVVIALYRVAFVVIDNNDMLLFLSFAAGLLIGVGGPVLYTVWGRKRSLSTIGLSLSDLPRVALVALIFAAVQFMITLWGYDLPATQDWATLLGMALMVGIFESIYFRGFVQGRLEASFGVAPAIFGAAILYGLYHLGYGMGLEEIAFLSGLGIIYALAYLSVRNVLVMWPLLTPLGNLFAQLESGELAGRLPWAALLGFADVIAVMATIIWFAHRHERKTKAFAVV